jgi:transposase InsO family protein
MTASNRREIVQAVDAALQKGATQASCCETLSLCERRLQRWRKEVEDKRVGGYRAKDQRLSTSEIEVAVVLIQKAQEARKPLRCAYAEHLDVGQYVCSVASLYRIRNRLIPVESRPPLMMKRRRRRELKAETVNSVWCWDITPMRLRIGGRFCYFYAFMDLFSRKIVAWTVEVREDGLLARDVLADAIGRWISDPSLLTVHSDNGSPMKQADLMEMLRQLNVRVTRSRPHVSDDNAFIESLFATLKSRMAYPESFGSLDEARGFCARFVSWYNTSHRHSALDSLTPDEVFNGQAERIQSHRNAVLAHAHTCHPIRFGSKRKTFKMPGPAKLRWALQKN